MSDDLHAEQDKEWGLQREHLPKEFQTIEYEGSRPLRTLFGDVMY